MVAPPYWIASIRVRNLGPLVDEVVDLGPFAEVARPSQWGKSTLTFAVSWCLWGKTPSGGPFKPHHIHDRGAEASDAEGARQMAQAQRLKDKVSVEITTDRGAKITRTRTRSGTVTRSIQKKPGGPVLPHSSEETFAKALGPIGRTVTAGGQVHQARLVLVPFAWRDLCGSPGNGRRLRDFLAATLVGSADLRGHISTLMAPRKLVDGDPTTAKQAEAKRKQANATSQRLKGAATEAQRALARLGDAVAPPDAQERLAAKQTCRVVEQWAAYDAAAAARSGAQWNADRWTRQYEALPPVVPGYDPSKRAEAEDDVRTARGFVVLRKRERRMLEDTFERAAVAASAVRLQVAEEALAAVVGAGAVCASCGGKQTKGRAQQQGRELQQVLDTRTAEHKERRAASKAKIGEIQAADDAVDAAAAKVDRKVAALDAFNAGHARQLQLTALGLRPPVPAPPTPPATERPSLEAAAEAKKLVEAAGIDEAVAQAADLQRDRARTAAEWAERQAEGAAKEAARAEALLDAVRRAPSLALVDAIACLNGDGVMVRLAGDGCEVFIDGREWSDEAASRGRRIAADASLRAALRDRLKLGRFPMVIDDRGNWSEELPAGALRGPVMVLRTGDGPAVVD